MCIIDEKTKTKVLKKIIETTQMMLKNAPNRIKFRDIDDPSRYNLPIETVIEAEDEGDAIDELSNKYGWCINSVEDIIPIP